VLAERVDHKVTTGVDLEEKVALCDLVIGFVLGHGVILA
jgi:hypothetical protein